MRPVVQYLAALVLLLVGGCPALTPPPPSELTWQIEYDDGGRPSRVTDPAGHSSDLGPPSGDKGHYEYDGYSRLIAVHQPGAPTLGYTYDGLGRVSSVTIGNQSVHYQYDVQGRVSRVRTPAGDISYAYQVGQNLVLRTLPSGVTTAWRYAADGGLSSITHAGPDRRLLGRFSYYYQPDGSVESVEEETPSGKRSIRLSYDWARRLTAVQDSVLGLTTYRYDPLGNRTMAITVDGAAAESTHDFAGRLVRHRGERAEQDPAGRLTAYARGGERVTISYDPEGHIASARTGGGEVRYHHDQAGGLVAREAKTGRSALVIDASAPGLRPLLAVHPDGHRTLYLWDGPTILGEIEDGAARFFLPDHLGSVRGVVDAQGHLLRERRYEAFGRPLDEVPGDRLQPSFAGLFFDGGSELYLTRHRAYDPALGRFLQRDPQIHVPPGPEQSLSAYAYCGNDPFNWIDEDGAAQSAPEWRVPPDRTFKVRHGDEVWTIHLRNEAKDPSVPRGGHGGNLGGPVTRVEIDTIQARMLKNNQDFKFYAGPKGERRELYQDSAHGRRGGTSFDLAAVDAGRRTITLVNHYTPLGDGRKADLREWAQYKNAVHQIRSDPQSIVENMLKNTSGRGDGGGGGRGGRSPQERSPVGGVALAGAGEALAGLGQLRGMARDENGRLVLLAEEDAKELPTLRLDDLVTVFRSVYEMGQAPSVSIDPDPAAPRGDFKVWYSPGTQETYVGWVLFESDRVMKTYSLGKDNLPQGRRFPSRIAGHRQVLDAAFADPWHSGEEGGVWQRFWLVPAEVRRRLSGNAQLALLEVPLRVNTERMVMKEGKLETAPDPTPTPSALAFSEWFTANYAALTKEVVAPLPKGHGLDFDRVPIYAELERIALMSAMAERLREQGVPMPAWMLGHQIHPFPTPPTTPAVVVNRQRRGRVISTRGGANLSVHDEGRRTLANDPEAESLLGRLQGQLGSEPVPASRELIDRGAHYRAAALPGSDTQALGAYHQEEVDVDLPIDDDFHLRLTRTYHSFFRPVGSFGAGWALDLPSLRIQQQPTSWDGRKLTSHSVYQLYTPFNTYSARFSRLGPIPGIEGQLLLPDLPGAFLGMSGSHDEHHVHLKDGRQWIFAAGGALLGTEEPPWTVAYRLDGEQRINAIEARYGQRKRAEIVLGYDDRGRVVAAEVRQPRLAVRYAYDAAGALARVERIDGIHEYTYRDGLLTEVHRDGRPVRRMEYGRGGQLQAEWRSGPDGISKTTYRFTATPQGVTALVSSGDRRGGERAEYDAALRPLRRTLPDGTAVTWRYGEGRAVTMTITRGDGQRLVMERGADAVQDRWVLPAGGTLQAVYDEADRLTEVMRVSSGKPQSIVQRTYEPLGRLRKEAYETFAARYEYGQEGALRRILLTPPADAREYGEWFQVEFDEDGRVSRLGDGSKYEARVTYHPSGAPAEVRTGQGHVRYVRDEQGRPLRTQMSWGEEITYAYDPRGAQLTRSERTRSGKSEIVEYQEGRPAHIRHFDGGEVHLSYLSGEPGLLDEVRLPEGLILRYEYDRSGQPAAVRIGDLARWEYAFDGQGHVTRMTIRAPGAPTGPVRGGADIGWTWPAFTAWLGWMLVLGVLLPLWLRNRARR